MCYICLKLEPIMLKTILNQCFNQEISVDKALQTIVNSFPKQYINRCEYPNDLELLDKVLDVYSLVTLNNELTKNERGVLKYYLKSGYSNRVKDSIKKDFGINSQHLNQINWKLTHKGFLDKHPTNNRSKVISPKLIKLRDTFFKDGVKYYTIVFEKNA